VDVVARCIRLPCNAGKPGIGDGCSENRGRPNGKTSGLCSEARQDEPPRPASGPGSAPLRFLRDRLLVSPLRTAEDGSVSFQFTVPIRSLLERLGSRLTRDLRSGSIQKETRSVKDLMVRPYLPRFLREGTGQR